LRLPWEVFKVLSAILVSGDVWEKAIKRHGWAVCHDILDDIRVAAFRWNPVRREILNFVQRAMHQRHSSICPILPWKVRPGRLYWCSSGNHHPLHH
jgi:hypothetical protein